MLDEFVAVRDRPQKEPAPSRRTARMHYQVDCSKPGLRLHEISIVCISMPCCASNPVLHSTEPVKNVVIIGKATDRCTPPFTACIPPLIRPCSKPLPRYLVLSVAATEIYVLSRAMLHVMIMLSAMAMVMLQAWQWHAICHTLCHGSSHGSSHALGMGI